MRNIHALVESRAATGLRENVIPTTPKLVVSEPEITPPWRAAARYVGRVRSFSEMLAAYGLVYDCYLERGYVAPSPQRVRTTFYNLLPDTATFVLSRRKTLAADPGGRPAGLPSGDDQIIGTVSVALDSEYGLPLAETFPEQLRHLRTRGRRVAEAIMLAHRPGGARRSVSADFHQLLLLLRCVTDYARLCKVDDICIQTNPHHVEFYKRKLAFELVDGPRPCPNVRGAPAVLLHHDMHTIRERSERLVPKASKFFLSGHPDPAILEGYQLRVQDVLKLLTLNPGLWRSARFAGSACDSFVRKYPDLAAEPCRTSSVVPFHPIQEEDAAIDLGREAVA